jgi:hypothetical protein
MPTWSIGKKKRAVSTDWSQNELDDWFYKGYDPAFLLHNAHAIPCVLDHLSEYGVWRRQQDFGKKEWWWEADTHFAPTLAAELFFTVIQQFEAFMALVLAAFQRAPHWLFLTKGYQPSDVKRWAETLLADDISNLTNGMCATKREFVSVEAVAKRDAGRNRVETSPLAGPEELA